METPTETETMETMMLGTFLITMIAVILGNFLVDRMYIFRFTNSNWPGGIRIFELLVRSRKFIIWGAVVVLVIILFGIIGSILTRDPLEYSSRYVEPPSSEFLLGTGNFWEGCTRSALYRYL